MSGLLEVQHSFGDFNFDEFAISGLQGRVHGFGSTESGFGCFVDFWGNVTGLCLEEVDEHPNCSYNEHSRAGPDEDDVPDRHPRRLRGRSCRGGIEKAGLIEEFGVGEVGVIGTDVGVGLVADGDWGSAVNLQDVLSC